MIESVKARLELRPTRCAICGTTGGATEMFPSTITEDAFDARHFSARRLPDRVHYRMVRCDTCGLIRSDDDCFAGKHHIVRSFARGSAVV